jgi:hypothetical protein
MKTGTNYRPECGHKLVSKKTHNDPLGAYLYCQNKECHALGKPQDPFGVKPGDPVTEYDE